MPSFDASGVHQQRLKRHHLNLLIQGAAVDAVVATDAMSPFEAQSLEVLDDTMPLLNNQVGVALQLSQFEAKSYVLAGMTGGDARRFWSGISNNSHPYAGSRLLTEHAIALAEETYAMAADRAQDVGIRRSGPRSHDRRLIERITRLHRAEAPFRPRLESLAVSLVSRRWGVAPERLSAKLQRANRPGLMFADQRKPSGVRDNLQSACSAGWSRIVFDSGSAPRIEAAGLVGPLLRHELVKGVAELSCSHGLASLDDETYAAVISATDKIALERYGMQVGHALFLRWRSAIPVDVRTATAFMHFSLSEPDVVETALTAAIDDPEGARQIMSHLCSRLR